MASTTKLFTLCSLLMALLFAYSASVQLNDHDWYLWFPLYSCACAVNLVNWVRFYRSIKRVAQVAMWVGVVLMVKVVVEGFVEGMVGFWCFDLSERVVREKMGSGLVVVSMFLHLEASSSSPSSSSFTDKIKRDKVKRPQIPRHVNYGMAILVGVSFGLPIVFFGLQKGELKL